MAPILTIIADTVGIIGGWMIAVFQLRVASSVYWTSVIDGLYPDDAWMGIIKPFCLGYVIATLAVMSGCARQAARRVSAARPRRRWSRRRSPSSRWISL